MPKDGDNVPVRAEPSSLDLLNTVGFHLLRFTQSPALRRRNSLSTPLDLQFLTVLDALLLLTPAAVRPVVLSLLPCAIIIEHGGQGRRNAELRVPGRKTS